MPLNLKLEDERLSAAIESVTHGALASCEIDADSIMLRANGGKVAGLAADDRKSLIERSRAGEHIELEFEAVTYIQRDEPNRNFVRFKDSRLGRIAKSGKGTPLLRDHSQRLIENRGGTVLDSRSEKLEDGSTVFRQTLRVTKPWAVQGVLDGTIDKFSIGWLQKGDITYRHTGKDIMADAVETWFGLMPAHWPGDELKDDDGNVTVVEWVYSDADLIEVSGVNVPAVMGTGIGDEIRAALSAAQTNSRTARQTKGGAMGAFAKVRKILGLSDSATEAELEQAMESKANELAQKEADIALREKQSADREIANTADSAIGDGRIPASSREVYQQFGLTLGVEKLREKLSGEEKGKFGPAAKLVSSEPAPADPVAVPKTINPQVSAALEEHAKARGITVEKMLEQGRANELPTNFLGN